MELLHPKLRDKSELGWQLPVIIPHRRWFLDLMCWMLTALHQYMLRLYWLCEAEVLIQPLQAPLPVVETSM